MLALTRDFGRYHPCSVGIDHTGPVSRPHIAGNANWKVKLNDSKGDVRVKIEHVLGRCGRK